MISLLPIVTFKSFLLTSYSRKLRSYAIWQTTSTTHILVPQLYSLKILASIPRFSSVTLPHMQIFLLTSWHFFVLIGLSVGVSTGNIIILYGFLRRDFNERTTYVREDSFRRKSEITCKMSKKKKRKRKKQTSKQEYNN